MLLTKGPLYSGIMQWLRTECCVYLCPLQLLTLDDLPESANIDLDEAASCIKAVGAVPRTPMSLIPYHESEKSGSILYSRTGEVLGSRMDFKVWWQSLSSGVSVVCMGELMA